MYPPIFSIVSSDAGVRSVLGANPVRVFPFGEAPDRVGTPYAVWQIVAGQPENYVTNAPDADSFVVQVDVYGKTPREVREAAEALRDALEDDSRANIFAWRGELKLPEMPRFRYSFDVEFLTER
jgi:hypothetical protein